MKNEKPNDTHAENEKAMPLGDDMLKDVAGGGLLSPTKREFEIGDIVWVKFSEGDAAGKPSHTAIVENYIFEEDLGTWTYQVRFGKYSEGRFEADYTTGAPYYYPQFQIYRN